MSNALALPADVQRCSWCGTLEDYCRYHDEEWGFPVADERRLFEKLCLEGFQAGLSWLTILRKRENFRKAFANFDIEKVARFGERDIERLLGDAGIVATAARSRPPSTTPSARASCSTRSPRWPPTCGASSRTRRRARKSSRRRCCGP